VRLQQMSLGCDSPQGPLGLGHARRSEFTDDSSAGVGGGGGYADAAELGSEAGSFHSCLTPLGSATGSGPAGGSIFRSAESSPDAEQQQQQQQGAAGAQSQRQQTPQGGGRK
jgi:hypothetical protein